MSDPLLAFLMFGAGAFMFAKVVDYFRKGPYSATSSDSSSSWTGAFMMPDDSGYDSSDCGDSGDGGGDCGGGV